MTWTYFADMPFSQGADFLLCSNGKTLSEGFRIAMGDGVESAVGLSENGLKLFGDSTEAHELISDTATPKTITFKQDHIHYDGAGVLKPCYEAILEANHVNSTVTPTAVPNFAIPIEAMPAGTYEIEIDLIVQSNSTSVGVRPAVAGPAAQLEFLSLEFINPNNLGASNGSNYQRQLIIEFESQFQAGNSPHVAKAFWQRAAGTMKLTADADTPLSLTLASQTAGTFVTMRQGSRIRLTRLL